MSLRNWLRNLGSRRESRVHRRGRYGRDARRADTVRPGLEFLEERWLLSFNPAVSYSVGSYPNGIVAADLNGDNQLDLAVTNGSSDSVSVMLGNSNGTFQAAQPFATGSGPRSIAVGDLDNDGDNDIVTANYYDLSVLLNNDNGTFDSPQSVALGTTPLSVTVGDFDKNGNMDLGVTSNYYNCCFGDYNYYGYYTGYANVLIGNGAGEFTVQSSVPLSAGYPSSVALDDVNDDTLLDMVTGNSDYYSVTVLLGDGNGGFASQSDFATGAYPLSVAVGNIAGDSNLDVITANYYGGNVSVLPGDGTGSFGNAQSFNAGQYPYSVALGDFNDDGIGDLLTANSGDSSVSVLM